jgi:hypothetical protein
MWLARVGNIRNTIPKNQERLIVQIGFTYLPRIGLRVRFGSVVSCSVSVFVFVYFYNDHDNARFSGVVVATLQLVSTAR